MIVGATKHAVSRPPSAARAATAGAGILVEPSTMLVERLLAASSITGPTSVSRSLGIADHQRLEPAGDHLHRGVGDVFLDEHDPQGRAALAGALERGRDHVAGDLLGQRRAVDDHRVLAAGLGDQRDDRAVALGERAVDRVRGLGRAGEGDARKRGSAVSAAPTLPSPGTSWSTSSGMPASCTARRPARRSAGSARRAWRAPRYPRRAAATSCR